MNKKPVYKHPDFVIKTFDKRIEKENKRLWLKLIVDENATESIVIILKNPSRATKDISDKTIFNVTNYIYKNREKFSPFKNIGTLIFLNLIPYYETYSSLLASSNFNIIDEENIKTISTFSSKHKNVLIAWGDHPKGLYNEYEILKKSIFHILKSNNNQLYFVDNLSKSGNPKHGQMWGYQNQLHHFNIE